MDLFEIVTTYSPILTTSELLASGLVLAAAVLGSVYLYRRKRIRASQAAAISAMTAFLLLVAGVTIFSRPPWERGFELVPFWSYGAIARGVPGMQLREMVLNCIMFLPAGELLPFIFGRPLRWHRGLLFGAVCSGCIEIAQLVSCKGRCETDDIIHNSIGCMVGCVVDSWVIGRLQGRKTGDNEEK
ncbi:MAG: VanZ family protein [Anaerovoracaceae bacterium]